MKLKTNQENNKAKNLWWWSDELANLSKRIIAIKRSMRNAGTGRFRELSTKLKEITQQFKETTKKNKKAKWEEYLKETDINTIWTLVAKIKNKQQNNVETVLIDETGATIDQSKRAEMIAKALYGDQIKESTTEDQRHHIENPTRSSQGYEVNDPNTQNSTITHQQHHNNERNYTPITQQELSSVFREVNIKKAPGEDGLDPTICENIRTSNPEILRSIYNQSLKLGTMPTQWKKSSICPIHKQKKGEKENPKNYRPIGLLSMLGKGLEKIVNDRITYHIVKNEVLSPHQHGFRPNHSTITALEELITNINSKKKQNKIVTITGFDFKGAFDNLSWDSILRAIKNMKIGKEYEKWFENYFTKREYKINYQTSTYSLTPTKGCVQGSPLSPTLWNIVVNELLLELEKDERIHIQAYADDLIIITGEPDYETTINKIKQLYKAIKDWSDKNGLAIAPEKTEIMLVKGKDNLLGNIKLDQNEVSPVKNMKILGVTVDNKLRWITHIHKASEKANNIMNIIQTLANKDKGTSKNLTSLIYNMVYLPTITYGCEIWYKASQQKNAQRILNKSQQRILQLMTGAYKSTKLTDLQILTQKLPLTKEIHAKAYKHIAQRGGETPILNPKDREIEQKIYPFTKLAPWETPLTRIQLPTLNNPNGPALSTLNTNEELIIFTDGSKMEQGTGAAFAASTQGMITYEKKLHLSQFTTIFIAEMIAIDQALNWVIRTNPDNKIIRIMSDSASSIQAIEERKSKNGLSQDIKSKINKIQERGQEIIFTWTRGHNDNPGNEYVDMLAKEATSKKTKPIHEEIPLSTIKHKAKTWLKQQWQGLYGESSKAMQNIFKDKQKMANIQTKDINKYLLWLMTNHGPTYSFLHKIKIKESPDCECGETQTGIHILTTCPIFNNIRATLLMKRTATPDEIAELLQKPEGTSILNQFSRKAYHQNKHSTPKSSPKKTTSSQQSLDSTPGQMEELFRQHPEILAEPEIRDTINVITNDENFTLSQPMTPNSQQLFLSIEPNDLITADGGQIFIRLSDQMVNFIKANYISPLPTPAIPTIDETEFAKKDDEEKMIAIKNTLPEKPAEMLDSIWREYKELLRNNENQKELVKRIKENTKSYLDQLEFIELDMNKQSKTPSTTKEQSKDQQKDKLKTQSGKRKRQNISWDEDNESPVAVSDDSEIETRREKKKKRKKKKDQ
ncbi:uncharacterized protein LOC128398044 [Panonychus citri]|uniref:uncharacterized protein LOC128398044 n=1 Tax=Panonychus citri TaxID=50023 RepID=UPI002306DD4C|nr:uncharacterized protein LOC128398044 [Panonychus citri]